eukprot:2788171-Pyramimonas_sp.AAC.1
MGVGSKAPQGHARHNLVRCAGHIRDISIIGQTTARTFERASRSHGHRVKKLDLTKRLYVSGAGHGVAVCDKSTHCKIACGEWGGSVGAPAIARLDTCSANVAEGSGDALPAILGLRSMSDMRAIWILEQGHEKMLIPCAGMRRLLLCRSRQGTGLYEGTIRALGD